LRLVVISGAVMMKITSSTSITSMSGVMLMSLIGCEAGLRSRRPNAMMRAVSGWRRAASRAVVGEAFEVGLAGGDPLAEDVVGEHGRNRDRDAAAVMTSASPTGPETRSIVMLRAGDARQRIGRSPHGAKEPTKGAVLPIEASSTWPHCRCDSPRWSAFAQAPRELRIEVPLVCSVPAAGRAVAASTSAATPVRDSIADSRVRPSSSVAASQKAGTARSDVAPGAAQQPAFPEHQHPGCDRHRQQQQALPRGRRYRFGSSSRRGLPRSGLQAEHVVHAVQARRAAGDEARGAQAAFGVVARLVLRCVISMRSPVPANKHRVVTDVSPPRTLAKPIVPGTRSPVWPLRVCRRLRLQVVASAFATTSPIASAVRSVHRPCGG